MFPPYVHQVKRLVITSKAGDWCRLPYPGHKRGCPNYDSPTHPQRPRLSVRDKTALS